MNRQDTSDEPDSVPDNPEKALERILKMINDLKFQDVAQFNGFKNFFKNCIERYGCEDNDIRYFLQYLADKWPTVSSDGGVNVIARTFYEEKGHLLLKWLVEDHTALFEVDMFRSEENQDGTETPASETRTPFLQIVLDRGNQYFVDTLLRISEDPNLDIWRDILSQPFPNKQNCLHIAILRNMSSSTRMVLKCSEDALLQADEKGDQPLHVAMRGTSVGRIGRGGAGALLLLEANERPYSSNTKLPRSNETVGLDSRDVYQMMRQRATAMPEKERREFMVKLLASPNSKGRSPYQLRLQTKLDDCPDPKAKSLRERELKFREDMKGDIFQYLTDVSDVRKALYGTEGRSWSPSLHRKCRS